jgi:hypothetical protein
MSCKREDKRMGREHFTVLDDKFVRTRDPEITRRGTMSREHQSLSCEVSNLRLATLITVLIALTEILVNMNYILESDVLDKGRSCCVPPSLPQSVTRWHTNLNLFPYPTFAIPSIITETRRVSNIL